MFVRLTIGLALGLYLAALCGCGGRLYNVTPLPTSTPVDALPDGVEGLTAVTAILDSDQSLERFEANLPMAGVIAVDVRLINRTSAEIGVNSLKFELRDAGGNLLKPLTPALALKRVMKFYGDGFYRKDAKQNTIESYEAVALPVNSTVPSQGELRGILFFGPQPGKTEGSGLSFTVGGATRQINIK